MEFNNRSFPDIFPDGCPPNNSNHEKIKVYRLVEKEIISENDFKSFTELGRDAQDSKNPFIEFGLSVNTDYEELKKVWRGNPGLKRKFKKICKGFTYICTGTIKATPSKAQQHHHTWWIYKEINPCNFFDIVEEVNN